MIITGTKNKYPPSFNSRLKYHEREIVVGYRKWEQVEK